MTLVTLQKVNLVAKSFLCMKMEKKENGDPKYVTPTKIQFVIMYMLLIWLQQAAGHHVGRCGQLDCPVLGSLCHHSEGHDHRITGRFVSLLRSAGTCTCSDTRGACRLYSTCVTYAKMSPAYLT